MQLRSHFVVAVLAFQILRPLDQSILESGMVKLVAKAGETAKLLVDGKPVATTKAGPNALSADLTLTPGTHGITLDAQKIQVFVKGSGSAPAGWEVFRPHPPSASCDACHVAKEGAWSVKSYDSSCAGCHNLAKFPQTHTHAATVLEECQLCHNPHGSKARFHLKFTKETACKQCHG
jgi:predicted CXXCH cytochrome family protein